METASTCLDVVYVEFVGVEHRKRLKYHCDLLTRGTGGLEIENRKAEEWATQLQCWSLYLLNCFACRERSVNLISNKHFLKNLCGMWSGLANGSSPAAIGIIRNLCNTKTGRKSVADSKEVIESLCNTSRSSDEWQYMAIDSLLLILKDPDTRYKVVNTAVMFLMDLVELRNLRGRSKIGETITQTLLKDYHKLKYGNLNLRSKRAERALEEIWDLKVERRKREKLMTEEEGRERKLLVSVLKQEGNQLFWSGDIESAMLKYTKALELCPLRLRKERVVLHSNRAQCHLLLRDPESAIRDSTRAVSLSSAASPHCKSLWRRSQAYDMKGLARESLMDCLMFINLRIKSLNTNGVNIPYYAARMITKQMNATWIFSTARSNHLNNHVVDAQDNEMLMVMDTRKGHKAITGMPTIEEEEEEEEAVIRGRERRKLETTAHKNKGGRDVADLTRAKIG